MALQNHHHLQRAVLSVKSTAPSGKLQLCSCFQTATLLTSWIIQLELEYFNSPKIREVMKLRVFIKLQYFIISPLNQQYSQVSHKHLFGCWKSKPVCRALMFAKNNKCVCLKIWKLNSGEVNKSQGCNVTFCRFFCIFISDKINQSLCLTYQSNHGDTIQTRSLKPITVVAHEGHFWLYEWRHSWTATSQFKWHASLLSFYMNSRSLRIS